METYQTLKDRLITSLDTLDDLLEQGRSIPGMTDSIFNDWKHVGESIATQLSDEIIRVAVVGSIKSGKSTFVNALIKGDYLKRGAGVVTSIVTRIRRGKKLQATLFFKSWDEVNADINQAMTLMPDVPLENEDTGFDIRRSGDRQTLEKALAGLRPDQIVSNGAVDANSVLLGSYLKGYEKVQSIVTTENITLDYRGDDFQRHWDFVANDALAVYLKDIRLEIASDSLTDYFEIADCQGSDSPNPHHLAMIQDYLNLTHMIIYVISSRTGLRQADIRFLSMIKQMGIMENIVFVVNCDLNEHDSPEDFERIMLKVAEELSYIKPDHTLFGFSALLDLFRMEKNRLNEKDARRLSHWELETALIDASESQRAAFGAFLNQRLNRDKYALLLKNHLDRMGLILSGIRHWVNVNQAVLSRDEEQIRIIADKIGTYQASLDRIRGMVRHTLEGSVAKLKTGLRRDVDQLFEQHGAGVLDTVFQFIRQYDIRLDAFGPELAEIGFTNAMYRVYQEFKQAMDMFMADTINPRILRFAREKESEIFRELGDLVKSYEVMVEDSLGEFDRSLVQVGITPMDRNLLKSEIPQLDTVKAIAGIQLPPAVAAFRYSAKIKTEALMRLGVYNAVKVLKQVLKKPFRSELERQKNALRDGTQRMKQETERSMRSHLKDYRENIKFQYVFKLSDAIAEALKEAMIDRFRAYTDSLMRMIEDVRGRKLDKARATEVLEEILQKTRELETKVETLHDGIAALGKDA
jgi:GTPase SAR1 family protein